jgi:hypothetical protein
MISTPQSRTSRPFLQVFESGPETRIGFVAGELPHYADDPACREELLRIIHYNRSRRLVFDLGGLRGVNSSLIALLLLPIRKGIEVTVTRPSRHLREVLRVTQVDRVLRIEGAPACSDESCGDDRPAASRWNRRIRSADASTN